MYVVNALQSSPFIVYFYQHVWHVHLRNLFHVYHVALSNVGIVRDPVPFIHSASTSYNIYVSVHVFVLSSVVMCCSLLTYIHLAEYIVLLELVNIISL